MPNSTDNQDLKQDDELKNKPRSNEKENDRPDENNFTSDNLKGKKVDRDPSKESDEPADV